MSCITVCILKCLLDHEMKCYTASCHRNTFDSILGQDLDKLKIKGKWKLFNCVSTWHIWLYWSRGGEQGKTSQEKYSFFWALSKSHTHTPPPCIQFAQLFHLLATKKNHLRCHFVCIWSWNAPPRPLIMLIYIDFGSLRYLVWIPHMNWNGLFNNKRCLLSPS